jgi:phasin family protein
MATQADTKTVDTKADAAAEKAYAQAADAVSPKKADEAAKPTAKIDAAVAEVKAAPKQAQKAVRKAKPAAAKKVAAPRKAAATKRITAKVKPAVKAAAPKAAKPSKPATTTISNLKDRIMATAKTTDFTSTVKTAAADAQTRAKTAYDKLQAYTGEVTEFTKGNVEALVEAGKILGAGVQTIARSEVEAAKGAFETATADMKAMVAVKSPTELFKLQGEIARRNFDMLVARTSKNAEVGMKLANDAFAPISSRMSVAAERISKAA